jgi:hypothetical protein
MSEYFRLFNEIGIIGQLSRALLEARLPPGFVAAQFSVLNHLVTAAPPLPSRRRFRFPRTR